MIILAWVLIGLACLAGGAVAICLIPVWANQKFEDRKKWRSIARSREKILK